MHDLIFNSSSSRRYFLSFSVPMQMELHKYNDEIHTAAELHYYADFIQKYNRAVEISEMLI